MAASATLEAHQQHPEHTASLSLARKMLKQCRTALDAAAGLPGAAPASEDATAVVLCMQVSRMLGPCTDLLSLGVGVKVHVCHD